jgi:hypothetical protein
MTRPEIAGKVGTFRYSRRAEGESPVSGLRYTRRNVTITAFTHPTPPESTMTRCAFILPALLFPLTLCAEDKKPTVFASKEGKFTVAMPEKPSEKTSKIPTDLGQLELHIFIVDQKERAYLVTYSDYPAGTVKDNADKILTGVVEGNAKSLKSKVASEEKITIGKKKHPGREIKIEMPDKKGLYRARIYLVGDRLYQVVALGPEEFAKGKEVDEYLKSFAVEE